jgi:hypothetical protein
MAEDPSILAESLSAEAANSAAIHAEAIEKARAAQMHSVVTNALKEVLSDETGSPLLIKRIPFICNDIRDIKKSQTDQGSDMNQIKKSQENQANNITWIMRIGSAICLGIGLLALKSLGV